MYRTLDAPFRRAGFIHFLISEVHPFADGNGRMARVMMNAELVAGDQERIVTPTGFRDNYIAGQRALTGGHRAAPMLRMSTSYGTGRRPSGGGTWRQRRQRSTRATPSTLPTRRTAARRG